MIPILLLALIVVSVIVYFKWVERRRCIDSYDSYRDSGPIVIETRPEVDYIPRPAAGAPSSQATRIAPRPAPVPRIEEGRKRSSDDDFVYAPPSFHSVPVHSHSSDTHHGGGHSGGGGASHSYDSHSHDSSSHCDSSSSDSGGDCGGSD